MQLRLLTCHCFFQTSSCTECFKSLLIPIPSDPYLVSHKTIHPYRKLNAEIKENEEKVKMSKQLPYLVGNVVEILNVNPDDLDDDTIGSAMDLDDKRTNKAAVVKTSTRQTVYLPIPGLVDVEELKPGDLIGTNKDSYLILEKLPAE